MKPTQQEIIEFAKQAKLGAAMRKSGGELRIFIEGADWHEELLLFATLLLEHFGAGGGEPVGYLPAYELNRLQSGHDGRLRSAKFGPSALDGDVAVYTHPSPTDLRAEYLRGLEDAKKDVGQFNVDGAGAIAEAIEALKGKQ